MGKAQGDKGKKARREKAFRRKVHIRAGVWVSSHQLATRGEKIQVRLNHSIKHRSDSKRIRGVLELDAFDDALHLYIPHISHSLVIIYYYLIDEARTSSH